MKMLQKNKHNLMRLNGLHAFNLFRVMVLLHYSNVYYFG
jgi:hypothetical protein